MTPTPDTVTDGAVIVADVVAPVQSSRTTRLVTAIFMAIALMATMLGVGGVLTSSMHPVGFYGGGAQMLRRLQTRTINITTRSSSFSGMPSSLKKGTTYKFVYKNMSSIAHNFRIGGRATSLCSQCTKSITVTFSSTGTEYYKCDPHPSMTKSVRIVD
jgi:plastocyanin